MSLDQFFEECQLSHWTTPLGLMHEDGTICKEEKEE